MAASEARIVLVTAASEPQAHSIARKLVEERLAACVNVVGPIRSIYRWRDVVEDDLNFSCSSRLAQAYSAASSGA